MIEMARKQAPVRREQIRLVREQQDAVYTMCFRVLGHPQDAEDAAQEALMEMIRDVSALQDAARIRSWVIRVAFHTALDFRRKRATRRSREAQVLPLEVSPSRADAATELRQGMARLCESDRALLVEYYFNRKKLRELAVTAGCSEVSIWKRIERARTRLRGELDSGGMTMAAPPALLAGILKGTGSASAGLSVAWFLAPVLVGVVVGAGALAGRSGRVELEEPRAKTAVRPVVTPDGVGDRGVVERSVSGVPAPEKGQDVPPVVKPEPYPYLLPGDTESPQARRTRRILKETRVTLNLQDRPLSEAVAEILRWAGLRASESSALDEDTNVSLVVTDLVADGALRLLLGPRSLAYEIRPDGTVEVGAPVRPEGPTTKQREVSEVRGKLDRVRARLDAGWTGVRGESSIQERLGRAGVVMPAAELSLNEALRQIREKSKVSVLLDGRLYGHSDVIAGNPRFRVDQAGSAARHVKRICEEFSLDTYVLEDNGREIMMLTDPETARKERKRRAEMQRAQERVIERMKRAVSDAPPERAPELVRTLERALGVPVRPSRGVWERPLPVLPVAGETWRQALDRLGSAGVRWGIDGGELFLVDQ